MEKQHYSTTNGHDCYRVYLPLPGYDKHGRHCVLMRPGKQDPATQKLEAGFKVGKLMDLVDCTT